MTPQQAYEKIREACIKANPSIMELGFEFDVYVNNKTEETTIRKISLKSPIIFDSFIDQKAGKFHVDSFSFRKIKEELRPIRLADVLLAMKSQENRVFSDQSSLIAGAMHESMWNLLKDDLRYQSDETKIFLAGLLD